MGNIDLINSALVIYLSLSAYLMIIVGRRVSASRQHEFAFAAILLLILGMFPQLSQTQVIPGIILSLGMMLIALHFSAYYSGTPKNSARMYAVLLFISSLMLAQQIHPIFMEYSIARLLPMVGVAYFLLEFEKIISGSAYTRSRNENIFLWIWIISACASLAESRIQILPDLFFLLLLITHMEQRWGKGGVPAPIVALNGTILLWYGHFIVYSHSQHSGLIQMGSETSYVRLIILISIILVLLWQSFRSQSLTKKYLYFFFAQEVLILGLGLGNIFEVSSELFALQRYLLFIAVNGMLVMIEVEEGRAVDSNLFKGMLYDRPRFTVVFLSLASMFMIYPGVLFSRDMLISNVLLGALMLMGMVIVFLQMVSGLKKSDQDNRILRPSLSIWSTVIFTILWSAVTILEIITRVILA